jgi:hypothetical protein
MDEKSPARISAARWVLRFALAGAIVGILVALAIVSLLK